MPKLFSGFLFLFLSAQSLDAKGLAAPNTQSQQSAENLKTQAQLFFSSGALTQAIVAARQALLLNPQDKGLLYDAGAWERKNGNPQGSKELFEQLLKISPENGDALEGLSIACLSLGQYDQAKKYLDQWNTKSPDSAYILGLLARANNGLKLYQETAKNYSAIALIRPDDLAVRRKLHDLKITDEEGILPTLDVYRSVGPEGLDTNSPQRIIYEGRSAETLWRARMTPSLNALMRLSIGEEAQRNQTGEFTYYDIEDRLIQLGAEGTLGQSQIRGFYGWSFLSDIQELGIGDTTALRAHIEGASAIRESNLTWRASRSPKFLRGASTSQFFAILKEHSLRALLETQQLGFDWRLRLGMDDYSEGTQWTNFSLLGTHESGSDIWQPSLSRSQQEFFGATDQGTIGYVNLNTASLRWRRYQENNYLVSLSYGYSYYNDQNSLNELNSELTQWLLKNKNLKASYRYNRLDYGRVKSGYLNTDEQSHWAGLTWQQSWFRNFWMTVVWEHGLLSDDSRGHYQADAWSAQLELHQSDRMAFILKGELGESTVDDHSYLANFSGRYNF